MSRNQSQIKLSKLLSYTLRHGAGKLGVPIENDGFVSVAILLNHAKFKNTTEADIREIVQNCEKQRFSLESRNSQLWIRANQGHSMEVEVNLQLLEPQDLTTVIHGTYKRHWDSIRKSGLSKMSRQHIHFASGLLSDPKVKSGMRKDCNLFIYIDFNKAIEDGIQFFRSANGVILTSGLDGILAPKYFSLVTDQNNEKLEW